MKSVKIKRVTMIDVATHRRWKTVKVVQTYKHNSTSLKEELRAR